MTWDILGRPLALGKTTGPGITSFGGGGEENHLALGEITGPEAVLNKQAHKTHCCHDNSKLSYLQEQRLLLFQNYHSTLATEGHK